MLEVEALPGFGPGARAGCRVDRSIGIAHDGHDDDFARLLLDEGDALLLQDAAHAVGAEGEVEAGHVAGRRVALRAHRDALEETRRLERRQSLKAVVRGDRHEALQQRAESGLLAVGHRLLLGGDGIGGVGVDGIVTDGERLIVRRRHGAARQDGDKARQILRTGSYVEQRARAFSIPGSSLALSPESPRVAHRPPKLLGRRISRRQRGRKLGSNVT